MEENISGGSAVKNLPGMQESSVQSLGGEDLLEKEMATHSSILAWETHGQMSLVGYPWGGKESDRTEQLNNNTYIQIGIYFTKKKE